MDYIDFVEDEDEHSLVYWRLIDSRDSINHYSPFWDYTLVITIRSSQQDIDLDIFD